MTQKFKVRLRSIAVVRTYVVISAENKESAWEAVRRDRMAAQGYLWDLGEVNEDELECEGVEANE